MSDYRAPGEYEVTTAEHPALTDRPLADDHGLIGYITSSGEFIPADRDRPFTDRGLTRLLDDVLNETEPPEPDPSEDFEDPDHNTEN